MREFVEVESGKRNDRPELAAALAAWKRYKAKLIIAKLYRLSRNLVSSVARPAPVRLLFSLRSALDYVRI